MKIFNYGHNVEFEPKYYYHPQNEAEVLEILAKHKSGQIRVVGSGHAWSNGIKSIDAFLDISALNSIKLEPVNNETIVNVGGGCKLEHLINTLARNNLSLPTMGGILKQSVAGLASTATHGTGRSSFSHYIESIRIANYDQNGEPKISEYSSGDELLAARTAIGCMGVIVSMKIKCVPRFWIEEKLELVKNLDEILANEQEWPLQQTVIIPHLWHFLSFKRRLAVEPSSFGKIRAAMMRFNDYVLLEMMPHIILKILLALKNPKLIINYYKNFLPKLILGLGTVNVDYLGLTLHTRHHYTFRHVETEIFIPEKYIQQAWSMITNLTDWFAGTTDLTSESANSLSQVGLLEEITKDRGTYLLHYTSFIRKVLPDQTLISMTANGGTYYAFGFFTYHKESDRKGYYHFVHQLALVLNKLYDARLHWGKNFPLAYKDTARLYPDLEKFKMICKQVDPNNVFQNDFTRNVLG